MPSVSGLQFGLSRDMTIMHVYDCTGYMCLPAIDGFLTVYSLCATHDMATSSQYGAAGRRQNSISLNSSVGFVSSHA